MKEIKLVILNEEEYKKKTIMDYLLFFFSATIISGVIIGFFYTKQFNWMTVGGYFLALFWLLTTWGYRGLTKGYLEYIKQLESVVIKEIEEKKKQL